MMLSGGEVAVKLAGTAAKNAAAMLLALARNHKKVYGKTSLKKILQQTRDFRTFSLTPEQYREFSRQAKDKVLFSADGFGKFGALDVEEEWDCEARRYYIGIVGKYGAQVQALLKKAAALDIAIICPLHGPALKDNLAHYINLYDISSSYRAESEGVMIAYTSVYGHTKAAAQLLNDKLTELGCKKVVLCDLARCDMAEAVEDAFRYGKLVLATTTYNGGIFPFMREFIDHLTERGYQTRTVAFIENGSWAPTAARNMAKMLEISKDIEQVGTATIRSAMTDENKAQLDEIAKKLA